MKFKNLVGKSFIVVGSMLLGSIVGGFVAASATPSSVTTCALNSTGVMRYSKSGTCNRNEVRLVLGQQGPVGPTGPIGPIGPAGATGTYSGAVGVRAVTTTFDSLVLADAGKLLTFGITSQVTIPADSTVAFPIGTRIEVARTTGAPFFVGATGVTVNGVSAPTNVGMDSGDYQSATLYKIAANTWIFLAKLD